MGQRIRDLRKKHNYGQEDILSFGFQARHWQQIEAGIKKPSQSIFDINSLPSAGLNNRAGRCSGEHMKGRRGKGRSAWFRAEAGVQESGK